MNGQTFVEKLRRSAQETGSLVCFGMDPTTKVFDAIAKAQNPTETAQRFATFYADILALAESRGIYPSLFKPNEAFWGKWDRPHHGQCLGRASLAKIMEPMRSLSKYIPITIDGKRGDIGDTSECYTDEFAGWTYEGLEFGYEFDSITVNPYLGSDGVEPFMKRMGVYVLNRTSNKSAAELQNLPVSFKGTTVPLYIVVSHSIIEWSKKYPGNVGAVVGATAPDELEMIARLYVESGQDIPLLIPGVGKQGGSASEVMARLRKVGYDISLVRINSSSALNFAFEKEQNKDYAGAAIRALDALNKEIGYQP